MRGAFSRACVPHRDVLFHSRPQTQGKTMDLNIQISNIFFLSYFAEEYAIATESLLAHVLRVMFLSLLNSHTVAI